MKRAFTFLVMLSILSTALVGSPAYAQQGAGAESVLNPWAVNSRLFVDGGPDQAETVRAYNCSEVEAAVNAYNADRPVGEQLWVPPMSAAERDAFEAWLATAPQPEQPPRPGGFGAQDLDVCTRIHTDGWKPANDSILRAAGGGSGVITVNVTGPLGCDQHGTVLMATATYYWWNGSWNSFYGTDWVELPGGGVLAEGNVTFECVDIIPGGSGDLAQVASAVPNSQVNINPLVQGLTGLDTWLWYDFSVPDSAELSIPDAVISARGTTWSLPTNVWVDQVRWDLDCVASCTYGGMAQGFDFSGYDYLLDLPDTFNLVTEPAVLAPADIYDGGSGTEEEAAAVHVYRTKDIYTVSTATVWRGYYEFLGVIYPYDPVVVAQGTGYGVVEIRSVLVTPEG